MRLLITAGPTREFLDDVRFLSSPSSGRMGFAAAEVAARRGHEVVLVTGPVSRPDLENVTVVHVTSALEMRRACVEVFASVDAVVMTASVSDFRPAERLAGKRPKSDLGFTLDLVPNPDILAELGRTRRPGQTLIGFALQVENGPEEARRKLMAKNLDWIVLNDPRSFGADGGAYQLFGSNGTERELGSLTKTELATHLVDLIESDR